MARRGTSNEVVISTNEIIDSCTDTPLDSQVNETVENEDLILENEPNNYETHCLNTGSDPIDKVESDRADHGPKQNLTKANSGGESEAAELRNLVIKTMEREIIQPMTVQSIQSNNKKEDRGRMITTAIREPQSFEKKERQHTNVKKVSATGEMNGEGMKQGVNNREDVEGNKKLGVGEDANVNKVNIDEVMKNDINNREVLEVNNMLDSWGLPM